MHYNSIIFSSFVDRGQKWKWCMHCEAVSTGGGETHGWWKHSDPAKAESGRHGEYPTLHTCDVCRNVSVCQDCFVNGSTGYINPHHRVDMLGD